MNMAPLHSAKSRSLSTFYFVLLLLTQFHGRVCAKITQRCLSNPCQNNATCYEDVDDYVCQCLVTPIHYIGKNCEKRYDACSFNPCQQHAACESTAGNPSFTCICPPGFSGTTCETEITECSSNPCRTEKSCQIGPFHNTCICTEGFTGAYCETDINECASDPCQNGAVCVDAVNGYSCFCVPGYQGKHCEIDVNECASNPCQNGALCINKIGRYECICQPGYTGISCELETDECQSEPCLNGATCQDSHNSYLCLCTSGFHGNFCEINIDECASWPCHHGGKCIDHNNGYSCDCSGTGYTGLHCETYIPLCSSQPCHNNATCEDNVRNYTCHCWPGFKGSQCEIDINECSSNPCLNGGECIERSREDLYGVLRKLPQEFKYYEASGYICSCQNGFAGTHCQDEVNECNTNPCKNDGHCENVAGGYICHCSQEDHHGIFYGGQNCSDILHGCESHECKNGGTCIPYIRQGLHKYSCICLSGYTGSNCQLITTFSFEEGGYLYISTTHDKKEQFYNVTLTFRTTQQDAVIFYRGNAAHFILLKLSKGHLQSVFQINNQVSKNLHILQNVSDGEWHKVETTVGDTVAMKLMDKSCDEVCENQTETIFNDSQLFHSLQDIFFGGFPADGRLNEHLGNINTNFLEPYFVGCLQDVHVDSKSIVPENVSGNQSQNLTLGCQKNDWCKNDPCQGKGQCVNLWLNYYCDCYRPYKGINCSEEYIAGRFGQEDTIGYAAFSLDETYAENFTISLFVRTRKPSGLILVLKNVTSHYIRIWLDDGRLKLQIEDLPVMSTEHYLDDGYSHFIMVKTEQGKIDFLLSDQKLGSIYFHPLSVQKEDMLFIGGLPDQHGTRIYGGNFKGCVQDLRLNSKELEFYPSITALNSLSAKVLENMTKGCPGDDFCKSNPCQNGGSCSSLWDDFVCTCPQSTAGKTCKEVRWCELNPCPSVAQCQAVYNGFECAANARFTKDSMLSYRGNGKIIREMTHISFTIQTRTTEATVLYATKEPEELMISIEQSHLVFKLQSGNSFYITKLISSAKVSDGSWHRITLSMTSPTSQSSQWQMTMDDNEDAVSSTATTGNLNFLREETDIYLAGGATLKNDSFIGCLGTVDISGISLSYFENFNEYVKRPQQEQFIKTSPNLAIVGCVNDGTCLPNPCVNGGSCVALNHLYQCACPIGWTGTHCESNINECLSSPCFHGNCTDLIPMYECNCEPGYTGKMCDVNTDECGSLPCVNDATCVNNASGFSCICPAHFTGKLCEYSKLPAMHCGDKKENLTCHNGGNCTKTNGKMMCSCIPGITGESCELDIDECSSDPCLNGGLCQNLLNRFQCICDVNFAGDHCEIDLKSDRLASEVIISVGSIVFALLLVLCLLLPVLIFTVKKRASQGTYSPSRQEKEGSRVELWNVMMPPPMERLI
ncbi:protein crumbs homolog 1 [Protopterus annectens]|uniref:protein crumbs homolog 1 n=1 Tax=Protopterus annectens TaxID=7888 RepID=UPI001CFBAB84|nr:protein crumbs homolog 1 [Protopterus annectens]